MRRAFLMRVTRWNRNPLLRRMPVLSAARRLAVSGNALWRKPAGTPDFEIAKHFHTLVVSTPPDRPPLPSPSPFPAPFPPPSSSPSCHCAHGATFRSLCVFRFFFVSPHTRAHRRLKSRVLLKRVSRVQKTRVIAARKCTTRSSNVVNAKKCLDLCNKNENVTNSDSGIGV